MPPFYSVLVTHVMGYTRASWARYMNRFTAQDWGAWAADWDDEVHDADDTWAPWAWEDHYANFSTAEWVRWLFWDE